MRKGQNEMVWEVIWGKERGDNEEGGREEVVENGARGLDCMLLVIKRMGNISRHWKVIPSLTSQL